MKLISLLGRSRLAVLCIHSRPLQRYTGPGTRKLNYVLPSPCPAHLPAHVELQVYLSPQNQREVNWDDVSVAPVLVTLWPA